MRVEQRKAMAGREIGQHQVVEQGRLAGAGLADDVEMPAQVAAREDDRRIQLEPDRGGSQLQHIVILGHGSPSEPVRSLAAREALSWHCLCVERPSRGRAAAAERGRLISLAQIVAATTRMRDC